MENFNTSNLQSPLGKLLKEPLLDVPVIINEYGGIYDKPKALKISFLQSRLNRDNFWNLMFFVGMNLGCGLVGLITWLTSDTFRTTTGIIMWITLLTVPYVIKKNSGVTFDKEKLQFLNRDNEILNDRAPNFFLLIVCTIGLTALTGLVLDGARDSINNFIALSIIMVMPTFIPTVYCILKNFPIAVYFKKETYIGDGTARSYCTTQDDQDRYRTDDPMLSLSNLRNSPINFWYSGNIYHRDR